MFIQYTFATASRIPAGGGLFEYLVAQNGVFVYAKRPGIEVLAPIVKINIRGLVRVQPFFRISEKIPSEIVIALFRTACEVNTQECMFYLHPNPWHIMIPEQVQCPTQVRPVNAFDPKGTTALVEIHSHHQMKPYFSTTDDTDEQTGFRIYTVLGHLPYTPSLCVRVGVYGHFWNIPAKWVFDLPSGVYDTLETPHGT